MTQRDFIDKASDACLAEQLATIGNEDLREHWRRIIRKYIWAYADQFGSKLPKLRELILEIEMHCPCGARPESPNTHPHVGGCPVAEALWVLDGNLDPYEVKEKP